MLDKLLSGQTLSEQEITEETERIAYQIFVEPLLQWAQAHWLEIGIVVVIIVALLVWGYVSRRKRYF